MVREIDVPDTDDSLHRVLRLLATTVRHGTVDSSLTFDRRWNCPQCRPQLVRRQVKRIAEAPWSEIWIQIADNTTPVRRSAREKANRRAADFCGDTDGRIPRCAHFFTDRRNSPSRSRGTR